MSGDRAPARPLVSVIVAIRNEAAALPAALASLREQRTDDVDLEYLLVDGMSVDGSREIAAAFVEETPAARLIENPGRSAPQAFNLGLARARGELVAILGAHAVYPRDYLAVCAEELLARDASGCSGQVRVSPRGEGFVPRLLAAMYRLSFAVSGRSFRTRAAGFCESIPYPVFRRAALLEVGGYDTDLVRNQDNDLNRRLCDAGHRLYLSDRVASEYRPPGSLGATLRYAARNGYWNVYTLGRAPRAMSLHHFVPLLFVLALLSCALLAIGAAPLRPAAALAALTLLGAHLALGLRGAWRAGAAPALGPCLPPLVLAFHLSYGIGSLAALCGGAWWRGRRDRTRRAGSPRARAA